MRCHIGDISFGSALFGGIEVGAKVQLVYDVRKCS